MGCNIAHMKQRSALIERLVSLQPSLRRRFVNAMTPPPELLSGELEGVTVLQLEVMRRLLDQDGMTMHEVAQVLGVGPSGATQLVDRLEQRHLVTRVRDLSDRRVYRVIPTERARSLGEQFRDRARHALESMLAVLDDAELATYVDIQERIARAPADAGATMQRQSA